jgi:hypothetical protein
MNTVPLIRHNSMTARRPPKVPSSGASRRTGGQNRRTDRDGTAMASAGIAGTWNRASAISAVARQQELHPYPLLAADLIRGSRAPEFVSAGVNEGAKESLNHERNAG